MMRGRPDSGIGRLVAALLVLALLALPGAAARHASAAAPSPPHAAHPCPADAGVAPEPAPSHHGGHPGQMPGLGCCLAGQCLGPAGAPPPTASALPPPPAPSPRFAAVPRLWLGIDIPPALPPPRAA